MKLYDQPASGNCLKCRIVLRQLGVPYETAGRLARARVHGWMVFEQNQIEATIADGRFPAAAGARGGNGGVRERPRAVPRAHDRAPDLMPALGFPRDVAVA